MKVYFSRQIYSYIFHIFKLNNLKVIYELYSSKSENDFNTIYSSNTPSALKKWIRFDSERSPKYNFDFLFFIKVINKLPCSWLQNNLFCSHFELR
jgi:hypothetical protein